MRARFRRESPNGTPADRLFLATLRIGESGKAMIQDFAGRLFAFRDADRTIRQNGKVAEASAARPTSGSGADACL